MLKTLNDWLQIFYYQWVDGQERLYKALFTEAEAVEKIGELKAKGAIRYVRI